MLRRPAERGGGVAGVVLTLAVLLLAGCTSGSPAGSGAGGAAGKPGATDVWSGAVLRTPQDPAVVLDRSDAVALARAATDLLFVSAPVVVVAAVGDEQGTATAAEQAATLHAPVLLAPASPQPAASSSSSAQQPPTAAEGGGAPLADELRRLGTRTVLAVGDVGAASAGWPGDVGVVTRAGDVPRQQAPTPLAGVTVLVPRDGGGPVTAVSGTARAAGATVVPVTGGDPRADADAVTALAEAQPEHVIGVGAAFGPADRLADRAATAATGVQLPGGGQVFFPGRRLTALYGHPGTPGLGALGQQDLAATVARAKAVAADYAPLSDVPVVPTFEIIATTAQGSPGADGDYSGESSVEELRPWVEEAGRQGFYVVLDLQPGRADLLDQAELYRPLLELPSVGLALDPEWALGPGQVPLQQIGGVDAAEINRVSTWLDGLTAAAHLPQKLLVVHQFRLSMVRDEQALQTSFDHIAVLVHMDGQGPVPVKMGTWAAVTAAAPPGTPFGWKDFYEKDPHTMTPAETMAVQPTPLMISYQ